MKPAAKLRRRRNVSGRVRANTLAAPLGGVVVPRELVLHEVPVLPVDLEQVPVERPVRGRLMAAMTSKISSVKRPTAGMNSSVVPGCSRTTAHRASSSSRLAWRDGTGAPVWSL